MRKMRCLEALCTPLRTIGTLLFTGKQEGSLADCTPLSRDANKANQSIRARRMPRPVFFPVVYRKNRHRLPRPRSKPRQRHRNLAANSNVDPCLHHRGSCHASIRNELCRGRAHRRVGDRRCAEQSRSIIATAQGCSSNHGTRRRPRGRPQAGADRPSATAAK
jgi:hypothetical protein